LLANLKRNVFIVVLNMCLHVAVASNWWNVNAAALAEKLDSDESGDENGKLVKEAIINCRQNEAYLRIIHVNITLSSSSSVLFGPYTHKNT